MHPYDKVLNKIEAELYAVKTGLAELPNANLANVPRLLLKVAALPGAASPSRLQTLQQKLASIKSKLNSALDTYTRGNRFQTDGHYLSRITSISAEIVALEKLAEQKDVNRMFNASDDLEKGHKKPTIKKSVWDDLKLSI